MGPRQQCPAARLENVSPGAVVRPHGRRRLLFTVLRWSGRAEIELGKWPNLKSYVDLVAARPKVQAAMKAEGLVQ